MSAAWSRATVAAVALMLFAGTAWGAPALEASLVNEDAAAKKGNATVQVKVEDFEIVDAASVKEVPRAGQGHLHYRVDDGPVIATTATKLSFHELTVGTHRLEVMLVGNDHNPIGVSQKLSVTIPASAASMPRM